MKKILQALLVLLSLALQANMSMAQPTTQSTITKDQIRTLYDEYLKQCRISIERNGNITSHSKPMKPAEAYARWPENLAQERILTLGRATIPLLIDLDNQIFKDSGDQYIQKVSDLDFLLRQFDDMKFIGMFARQYLDSPKGELDDICFQSRMMQWLHISGNPSAWIKTIGSLDQFAAYIIDISKKEDYSKILDALDFELEETDMLFQEDYLLIRWFNLFNNQDMDEYIDAKSPKAMEWRKEQLEKGYDPILSFVYLKGMTRAGLFDQGLQTLFPDPANREACKELFKAIYPSDGVVIPKTIDRDKFMAWYKANRSLFVYDKTLCRFVVPKNKMIIVSVK